MARTLGLDSDALSSSQRGWLVTGGAVALAAGTIAVFVSENGAGAAALVAVGAVAAFLGVVGRRPTTIDAGGVKVDWAAARAAQAATEAADKAEAAGAHELASSLRQEASILAAQARAMAHDIDAVRAGMPSSWERTEILEEKMNMARTMARVTPGLTPDQVADIFGDGGENRVVALGFIQARPDLDSSGLIEEAITQSRSAFEQYQALKAARNVLSDARDLPVERIHALRAAASAVSRDSGIGDDRIGIAHEAVAAADRRLSSS